MRASVLAARKPVSVLSADDCVAACEADTAQEILKPGVGPERIEDRSHEDGRIESRLIGLVQPDHRPVVVAESDIDQGNARVGRRVLTLPTFQVPDYLHCFFLPS